MRLAIILGISLVILLSGLLVLDYLKISVSSIGAQALGCISTVLGILIEKIL